jgi:adenylate cyclase, class 2
MAGGESLEVEVKFCVARFTAVRPLLLSLGQLKKERVYEQNVVYDTAVSTLRHHEQLLRLRQDEQVRLTFKGPAPAAQSQSEAKVREELEVSVDNFGQMAAILGKLGFMPVLTYEKYRETFQVGAVEVVLDELPYGLFIELEGADGELPQVAMQLGLDWSQRLLTNYLALFGELQTRYQLPFTDLTFANFAGVPHNATAVWGNALQKFTEKS